MGLPFRISTAPPSFSPTADEDMSFYCDLIEVDDRAAYALPKGAPADILEAISNPETIVYSVWIGNDREVGLLLCREDEEEELMYCGIDSRGTVTREPAANEALWTIANVTLDFPSGYRFPRVANPSAT